MTGRTRLTLRVGVPAGLFWPTVRATALGPVACGTVAAAVLVGTQASRHGQSLSIAYAVAVVVSTAGIGFALDDRAAATLAPSPTTLRARRLLRAALALSIIGVGWLLLAAWVVARRGADAVPIVDLMLELGTVATLGLAAAAVALRRNTDGGPTAAATVLIAPALVSALRAGWLGWLPMLVPHSPHHDRWSWLLVGAVVVFTMASRDAARPRCTEVGSWQQRRGSPTSSRG